MGDPWDTFCWGLAVGVSGGVGASFTLGALSNWLFIAFALVALGLFIAKYVTRGPSLERELLDEAFAVMEQADHRSLTLKATQLRRRLGDSQ